MAIQKIQVFSIVLHYREPFIISAGAAVETRNIVIKVTTDCDVFGWGEASPSKRVTNETAETVLQALDKIAPHLIGMCPLRIEQINETMDKLVKGNSSAKAAVDIALHDIVGKTARRPLWRLMGGYREKVLTDITLSIKSPEQMAEDAAKAVRQGFRALKVKVGTSLKEDVERVQLIREKAGSDIALRVDANQAWSVEEAVKVFNCLEPFNIEFIEQPIAANDVRGLARIKAESSIPVMADEAIHSPRDALHLILEDAVDLINIKLMKCGGVQNAKKIAAIAEAANVSCMIGCMGESQIGIAAAAHTAMATKNICFADLDSDLLIENKLADGIKLESSYRVPSQQAGLGLTEPNLKLLGKPLKTY